MKLQLGTKTFSLLLFVIFSLTSCQSTAQIGKFLEKAGQVTGNPTSAEITSGLKEALEKGTLREAFGTGTAATIAHIFKINVNGKDYQF